MQQIINSVCGNNIFAIIGRSEIESILDTLPSELALVTITDPNLDFIKHNNKFDKIENFFSGIKDNDNDNNNNDNGTTSQMELFFDAIIEYKSVKKSYGLDDDACMRLIYLDSNSINDHEQTIINNNTNLNNIVDLNNDTDKILELFSKEENQIYMLDLGIKRYISPSLLICLNYIYEKKLDGEYWNIYILRNV